MADSQAEKMKKERKKAKKDKISSNKKDIDDLVKVMFDPQSDDCLLDDDGSMLESDWTTNTDIPSLGQTWDGVDSSSSLLNTGSLSSLPFGEAEAAEAAAAATEGLPTYRNSSRAGTGGTSGTSRFAAPPQVLPVGGYIGPPEDMSAEQAALEDYLMHQAVSEGMKYHHARLENAHSKFAVSIKFAELLERVESDDVRRNAAPLLPGTSQKMPTWIRAGDELNDHMEELNARLAEAEIQWDRDQHARMQEEILEDVEAAMRLLAATNPNAGIGIDEASDGTESLDELFGGDESTLLPGVGKTGFGLGRDGRDDDSGDSSSRRRMISRFLDEIFPEGGDFSSEIADSIGFGGGDPRGETERVLASIDEDVEKALEERFQSIGIDEFSEFEMEDEVIDDEEEALQESDGDVESDGEGGGDGSGDGAAKDG